MTAVKKALDRLDEVDENLVHKNPSLHIEINKDEPELKPHCICFLWTQLTTLIGINLIDADSSQPIIIPEDFQAFLTIITALSHPESDLDNFCNQFFTCTPVDNIPVKSYPQWYVYNALFLGNTYAPTITPLMSCIVLSVSLGMRWKPGPENITLVIFLHTLTYC